MNFVLKTASRPERLMIIPLDAQFIFLYSISLKIYFKHIFFLTLLFTIYTSYVMLYLIPMHTYFVFRYIYQNGYSSCKPPSS
jgi:hypothetical protein